MTSPGAYGISPYGLGPFGGVTQISILEAYPFGARSIYIRFNVLQSSFPGNAKPYRIRDWLRTGAIKYHSRMLADHESPLLKSRGVFGSWEPPPALVSATPQHGTEAAAAQRVEVCGRGPCVYYGATPSGKRLRDRFSEY